MKKHIKYAIIQSTMMMGFCFINPTVVAFYYTGWGDLYPIMHTTAAVLWGVLIAASSSFPKMYLDRTFVLRLNKVKTLKNKEIVFDEIQCYGLLSSHWDRVVVYKKFIEKYF